MSNTATNSKPRSPTKATTPAGEIEYRNYAGENDLKQIMALVETELSEPYVVYTYRYFLQGWPKLSFLAFPPTLSHSSQSSATDKPPNESTNTLDSHSSSHGVDLASEQQQQQQQQQRGPIGVIICKQSLHRHSARRGYIAMLSVARSWRKRGIASTLVKKSIDNMIQNGADEVVLETEVDNAASLALYNSLGFMKEKRLYRFYMNGKDAFRLVLPLKASLPQSVILALPLGTPPDEEVPKDVDVLSLTTKSHGGGVTRNRIYRISRPLLEFSDDEDDGWYHSER